MKTAYIFHDAFCDPLSDWYPWMKMSLEQQGYVVVLPKFPTPAGQSYESWKMTIKNYLDKFDTETLFIGHGTGGAFALRLAEELAVQIHGLFLVASYTEPLGHIGYDRVNETFIKHNFDWEKIRSNTLTVKVFGGQGDPFVPATLTDSLASHLETSVITIPEGGHINKASGFTQCIPLLQGIKEGLGEIDKSMVIETPQSLAEPRDSSSWQGEQIRTSELSNSVSPSYQEGVAEDRGSLEEKKFSAEAPAGVHTMYQDMTRLVNSNQGKVASSLLGKAHEQEAEKKLSEPSSPVNTLYIAGTFAVIVMIIGIGAWVMTRLLPAQKNNPVPTVPSLIQAEVHQNINILGKQSYEITQAIGAALVQTPNSGSIMDIYYTRGGLRASFADVLESIDLGDDIPESFKGEFLPAGTTDMPVFMHAAASFNGTQAHALILPISHYDKTFSAMRDWEPTMFRDLGVFMNVSPTFLKTKLTKDLFHDEMVANKNLRVLRYKKPADIAPE
jgi:predicted alpha/beta hydrolase family esterase